jgi:hypothetical protein
MMKPPGSRPGEELGGDTYDEAEDNPANDSHMYSPLLS